MPFQELSPISSEHPREDEPPPLGTSNVMLQPSDPPPTASPRDAPLEENLNAERLLPTWMGKSNKDPALHESDRVPIKSRRAADHQSHSHSPARVEATNEGPAKMAAARPKQVNVSLMVVRMWGVQHIMLASGCDIFQSARAQGPLSLDIVCRDS